MRHISPWWRIWRLDLPPVGPLRAHPGMTTRDNSWCPRVRLRRADLLDSSLERLLQARRSVRPTFEGPCPAGAAFQLGGVAGLLRLRVDECLRRVCHRVVRRACEQSNCTSEWCPILGPPEDIHHLPAEAAYLLLLLLFLFLLPFLLLLLLLLLLLRLRLLPSLVCPILFLAPLLLLLTSPSPSPRLPSYLCPCRT